MNKKKNENNNNNNNIYFKFDLNYDISEDVVEDKTLKHVQYLASNGQLAKVLLISSFVWNSKNSSTGQSTFLCLPVCHVTGLEKPAD